MPRPSSGTDRERAYATRLVPSLRRGQLYHNPARLPMISRCPGRGALPEDTKRRSPRSRDPPELADTERPLLARSGRRDPQWPAVARTGPPGTRIPYYAYDSLSSRARARRARPTRNRTRFATPLHNASAIFTRLGTVGRVHLSNPESSVSQRAVGMHHPGAESLRCLHALDYLSTHIFRRHRTKRRARCRDIARVEHSLRPNFAAAHSLAAVPARCCARAPRLGSGQGAKVTPGASCECASRRSRTSRRACGGR